MKDHTLSQIIAQLQAAAEQSSDLLHKNYRDTDRSEFVLNGLCYPLAEALSHLCPGLFTSWRIPWEDGSTHWFLRDQAGAVLDLVSHPGPLLCAPEDYAAATRARFLSHTPSRRARTLLERAGLTLPTPAHRTKGRHP